MPWDDPQDWIKLLTPKLTAPAANPLDESPNTLEDALESLYPRRWSSEAEPKEEVKPLDKDVVNYLKEQCVHDSEESLYDYGMRRTEELNRSCRTPMQPEPLLEFLYEIRRGDNLIARHAKEWIVGNHLEARWDINEDILRGTVLAELPVYRIMPDETSFEHLEKVPARDSRIWGNGIPNPLGSPYGGSTSDPLASPGNWWFKREDVDFYELLHPEICDARADLNSPWLAPSTLIRGFDLRLRDLLWLASDKGLRPYILTRKTGLRRVLPTYVWLYGFTGCLFKVDEVRGFVTANQGLCGQKKLGDVQLDNMEARAYALGRWGQDPAITIRGMAEDIQQTMNFRRETKYKVSTIYNWIKDLCPDRTPGRRKKKT
jgi:hypothetical protein